MSIAGFCKKRRILPFVACLFFLALLTTDPGIAAERAKEHGPIQLILALDTSGSMKKNDPLRLLPKAATVLVHLLADEDRLGLLSFDDNVKILAEPAPLTPEGRRQCLKKLRRLAPRGPYTDILAVLLAAKQAFEHQKPIPSALVLISDGHMDINPHKGDSKTYVNRVQQEIIPAFIQAKIPIFTVAFTKDSDQNLLKSLGEETGGAFLLVEKATELHQAFAWIFERLKQPQLAPVYDDRFMIDPGVEEAVLIASRQAPSRSVSLTDPTGRRMNAKKFPAHIRWFSSPAFDMVTISQPQPGFWSLSDFIPGQGKVVLLTDLKLTCPYLPEEVGRDEALVVGAAMVDHGKPVTHPELLNQTEFFAAITTPAGEPITAKLQEPLAFQKNLWPAGCRVGRFPPIEAPGPWELKVQALGKTFQREVNFSLKVASPWYREELGAGNRPGLRYVKFQPGIKRPLKSLTGWISVQPSTGGIAASFFKPPDNGKFSLYLGGLRPGQALVDLRLAGLAPSGRPLIIRPPAQCFEVSAAEAPVANAGEPGAGKFLVQKHQPGISWFSLSASVIKKKWVLAVLFGVALISAILLAIYWWQPNLLRGLIKAQSSEDASPQEGKMLLMAQVETLKKEKHGLAESLKQMEAQVSQLTAEKGELSEKLQEQSQGFRDKAKVIGELEEKLKEAETEAKSVQQEYMALYARSQGEKEVLKKGG